MESYLEGWGRRTWCGDSHDLRGGCGRGSGSGADFGSRCVACGRCCTGSSRSGDNRFPSRISSSSSTSPIVQFVLRSSK